MEPLNEDELNTLLREWHTPPAPGGLPMPGRGRRPWWKSILMGSIRVPMPLGAALAVILLVLAIQALRTRPAAGADSFQPVVDVRPRLIRSNYDENAR